MKPFQIASLLSVLALTRGVSSQAPEAEFRTLADGTTVDLLNGEPFDTNPQYTYSFQVAQDQYQTYINKEESRDGINTVGTYSYVDANGALVTVNYKVDDWGYTEERTVEDGFVDVALRVNPTATAESSSSASGSASTTTTILSGGSASSLGGGSSSSISSSSSTTTTSGSAAAGGATVTLTLEQRIVAQVIQAIRPTIIEAVIQVGITSSAEQSALVARIIAQLTPIIRTTVSQALAAQAQAQTVTVVRPVQVQRPVVQTVQTVQTVETQPAVSVVEKLFGIAGANNIKFANDDINYNVDLTRV